MIQLLTVAKQSTPKQVESNLTQLAPSIIYDRANQTVYIGVIASEVKSYLKSLSIFSRCEEMEVRKAKYTDFDKEIVIRDLQEESDGYAQGLDYWVESENLKHWDKPLKWDSTEYGLLLILTTLSTDK